MSPAIRILRAGPSATIQDRGRFGALRHGISASGPMDRGAFMRAGAMLEHSGDEAIEFTQAGIGFVIEGDAVRAAFDGGAFSLRLNGVPQRWPATLSLATGDHVEITPGPAGNYGYVRFDHAIDVPALIGSRATNLIAGLGGLEGRALRAGDVLPLVPAASHPAPHRSPAPPRDAGPIRFIWGLHADLFSSAVRQSFLGAEFVVSPRLDRMGVRLTDTAGVFATAPILSLVSDAVVAGDIQILGDGTPIVLMRDHQPTGGYPRIATVISADLDRFAQLRPGTPLAFAPVTLHKAREIFLASRAV
ncbi:MAG TPA: biotin-dependent carboxyltransferase family protein [Devosiaceae bacterium]|nr:biotin-dependent carboxyltransferase family protein [Devosiaceae bacterium]